MNRRAVALLAALTLTVGACSDDTAAPPASGDPTGAPTTTASATSAPTTGLPDESTTTAPDGVAAIESFTRTLVDETRGTPATAETAELPSRTLEVLIDAPDVDEPRPLVIFSHGLAGHPRNLAMLRTRLAEAGFVVAAPYFR